MKQGHGRLVRHSTITVGGSGATTFKKTQYWPDTANRIKSAHQGHLSGAGVCKTNFDTGLDSSLEKQFGAVHNRIFLVRYMLIIFYLNPQLLDPNQPKKTEVR
jgi:hypothetical protein